MIFDGDCGFCTSVARWAKRRLPNDVRVVPWQLEDLSAHGLTSDDTRAALVWIDGEGRVRRGHLAATRMLDRMAGTWQAIASAIATPPVDRLAEVVYGVIARNRHRLPGGTPACALPR
jgi:predicted DCC family thiol-disulfide oxidoreductase YuxK